MPERSHYYIDAVLTDAASDSTGSGGNDAVCSVEGDTQAGKPLPLSGVVNALNRHGQMFKAQISVADLSAWLMEIGVLKQGEKKTLVPTFLGIASGLFLKTGRRSSVIYYDGAMQTFLLRHMEDILDHARGVSVKIPDDLPGLQR